jgi:serine/threonine protein kinase
VILLIGKKEKLLERRKSEPLKNKADETMPFCMIRIILWIRVSFFLTFLNKLILFCWYFCVVGLCSLLDFVLDGFVPLFFPVFCRLTFFSSTLSLSFSDLKPQNLLLTSEAQDADVVVVDFGFAKPCREGEGLRTYCGTLDFMAPEILSRKGPYGKEVDMWSFGIIFYILLGGCKWLSS